MNAQVRSPAATPPPQPPPPQPSAPRPPLAISGRDREFLPAALEILETPPPPLPVAMISTICAFALAALVWSCFGRLDVHAVAPGKIETAGYAKVIEPLDPGRIAASHVETGQSVKAGDLLLELDPAEVTADAVAAQAALDAGLAEIARRRYAIDAVRGAAPEEARWDEANEAARPADPKPVRTVSVRPDGTLIPPVAVTDATQAAAPPSETPTPPAGPATKTADEAPAYAQPSTPKLWADAPLRAALSPIERLADDAAPRVGWSDKLPEAFRFRETAVLAADLWQLADALKALDKLMAQKLATSKRLNMSIAFQEKLMETLNQRVSTRQEAINLAVGTKINLYDAREELERSQSQLASDQGQLIETDAALKELEGEKAKAISQFVADNENKLADAARKADEARQALTKAATRLARTKLYAPIDGVVQQTAVTTVGQVVTTGQQLVVITPDKAKLQVEALIANLDIGFVKVGQPAVIKLDAFPFTRFGVLHGNVVKIASGAIAEEDAKRAFANAAASANMAQTATTPSGQPENFVFPVTVALEETTITVDGTKIPLTPGMTATVEIKTGSRRVIDYLLSPLARIASEAGRER